MWRDHEDILNFHIFVLVFLLFYRVYGLFAPFRRLFLFNANLLLFASGSHAAAEEELPDNLLSEDISTNILLRRFRQGPARIIERMRERNTRTWLDIAEGDSLFNTGRATRGSVVQACVRKRCGAEKRAEYMDVLHRMISSYDCLHDEGGGRSVPSCCSKAPRLQRYGDESVALFNMGKMLCYQEG